MKRYLLYMLIFCLLSVFFCNTFAQSGKQNKIIKLLRVSVIAADDRTAIPEAIVYAEGNTLAGLYRGTSNQYGIAMLNIESGGEFTVTVNHAKFNSETQKVRINKYGDHEVYALSFRLKRKRAVEKESKILNVFVKDRNNKPVQGATVLVAPGASAVTNSAGYAKAKHMQQPGEYVVVTVQANGFKDQRQRILVGVAQGNAITRPDDVARFVLEKGDNERAVYNLIIEVLDDNNYQPVNGAAVKVELSDGTLFSGSTNNKGEVKFTDMEYGFQGTTARVIVTHKDYKEKWSDIPEELMTAKDLDVRKFLVSVSKKENSSWAGTWKDQFGTTIITSSGTSISAAFESENGWKNVGGKWSNCKVEGNTAKCEWSCFYEDNDKTGNRRGTLEATIGGNVITVKALETEDPKWKWKPPSKEGTYTSSMKKGAVWHSTLKRQ